MHRRQVEQIRAIANHSDADVEQVTEGIRTLLDDEEWLSARNAAQADERFLVLLRAYQGACTSGKRDLARRLGLEYDPAPDPSAPPVYTTRHTFVVECDASYAHNEVGWRNWLRSHIRLPDPEGSFLGARITD